MAAQDKALANKANKQRWAAAQDKALAYKANKQHWAATWEKALAKEQRCRESAECAAALVELVLAAEPCR